MEKKEYLENVIRIAKGSIIAIIFTLIALLIFAILLTYTDITENCMNVVIIVSSSISILLGGMISAIKIKKRGLINGMFVGLIYILTIYILSAITGSGFKFSNDTIIMFISCAIAGMVGGIIGVNLGNK